MLNGIYVSVEPFHLFRCLDERSYRFNNRKLTDAERFDLAVRGIVGKRIMYDQLIGRAAEFSNGAWRNRLGEGHDVCGHALEHLVGYIYGPPHKILSRPQKNKLQ
jgi:hypothetical protein